MNSFFFIPATNLRFLNKIDQIESDNIVLDLEDSIYNHSFDDAVSNILAINFSSKLWIRIPSSNENELNYLKILSEKGFCQFILPKVQNKSRIKSIKDILTKIKLTKYKLIILIEDPVGLINCSNILNDENVIGVGFGSHDYCKIVGMKHNLANLLYARMKILNVAKAFNKIALDITSINIVNKEEFIKECIDGKEKGFDGKFILHPWQLKLYNEYWQYNKEELDFALVVRDYIDSLGGVSKFNLAVINGEIVEKPHLERIKKILLSQDYSLNSLKEL